MSVLPSLSLPWKTNMRQEGDAGGEVQGRLRHEAHFKFPSRSGSVSGWARQAPGRTIDGARRLNCREDTFPATDGKRPQPSKSWNSDGWHDTQADKIEGEGLFCPFTMGAGRLNSQHSFTTLMPQRPMAQSLHDVNEGGGEEDAAEKKDDGGSEMGSEFESPMVIEGTKRKKKTKCTATSTSGSFSPPISRSLSPSNRLRSAESKSSSPVGDGVKSVAFAISVPDDDSTKWKLVLDKNRSAGSGQVSCKCSRDF